MQGIGKTLKRRRIESKTDYGARLVMLKSDKPRLVVRKTNKQIIMQIVTSVLAQDKVVVGTSSLALFEHGWPKELSGSLKSLGAAYLTGKLIAKLAKDKFSEVILDLGMIRNIKKSRIYAAVKGAVDGGLNLKVGEDVLPEFDEIVERTNDKAKKIFEKINKEIN